MWKFMCWCLAITFLLNVFNISIKIGDTDRKSVVAVEEMAQEETKYSPYEADETLEPTVHEMLKEIEDILLANKERERKLRSDAKEAGERVGTRLECLQELDFADWDDNDCPKV